MSDVIISTAHLLRIRAFLVSDAVRPRVIAALRRARTALAKDTAATSATELALADVLLNVSLGHTQFMHTLGGDATLAAIATLLNGEPLRAVDRAHFVNLASTVLGADTSHRPLVDALSGARPDTDTAAPLVFAFLFLAAQAYQSQDPAAREVDTRAARLQEHVLGVLMYDLQDPHAPGTPMADKTVAFFALFAWFALHPKQHFNWLRESAPNPKPIFAAKKTARERMRMLKSAPATGLRLPKRGRIAA